MTSFVKKMIGMTKRKEVFKEAVEYFTRPRHILDKEIRENLNISSDEPYLQVFGLNLVIYLNARPKTKIFL